MPRPPSQPGRTFVARTLRKLREDAGLTQTAVAEDVNRRAGRTSGLSQHTLARYENGRTVPPKQAVLELAAYFGVDDATVERMLSETREARQEDARVVLHRPYEHHFQAQVNDLEHRAESIQALTCTTLVSGLLQTDAYAAVLAGELGEEDRQRWLLNRARTRAVVEDESKRITVLTTEGPLRYPLGGAEVMREQIDHMLEVSERPNVELGVLAADALEVQRPLMSDSTIYRFPDGGRRVVYGVKDGTVILDDPKLIDGHEQTIAWASELAVWGDDARAVLVGLRRSYRGDK